MTNKEKYVNAFAEALEISADKLEGLKYQDIDAWDSVGSNRRCIRYYDGYG